jgi:hypothetical protein
MRQTLCRGGGGESIRLTYCGGDGANKRQPHGGGGESMQQILRRYNGDGGENMRLTHCGGGGGESRQETPGGNTSAARL